MSTLQADAKRVELIVANSVIDLFTALVAWRTRQFSPGCGGMAEATGNRPGAGGLQPCG
ncbi:hypothetical protein ACFT7S_04405 [Streptomyces sp. NPDC057136]|uniref:hypothetical protein n=1 Tax=Streptomyces sp. NPDC057136 TaxID=3346029 RepID=UPI00364265C4